MNNRDFRDLLNILLVYYSDTPFGWFRGGPRVQLVLTHINWHVLPWVKTSNLWAKTVDQTILRGASGLKYAGLVRRRRCLFFCGHGTNVCHLSLLYCTRIKLMCLWKHPDSFCWFICLFFFFCVFVLLPGSVFPLVPFRFQPWSHICLLKAWWWGRTFLGHLQPEVTSVWFRWPQCQRGQPVSWWCRGVVSRND